MPHAKSDKLDKKVEHDIFVDYSSTSKAYIVYQPRTRKIFLSKHVDYMDNDWWSWNDTKKEANS